MAYIRCEVCKGRKKMFGLGYMLKDCHACAGVGFVAEAEEPVKRKRRSPAEMLADVAK